MRRSVFWLSFFLISTSLHAESSKYRFIGTKSGEIRGIREKTFLKNVDFYSFRGIPYAKSPIGNLRFKAPEPVEPWSPNTLDASKYGNTCVRPEHLYNVTDNFPQDEDCLFLNIFVPADVKPEEKLAVMFWIHGGGFWGWSGTDHLFGPDFLIEKRVILVTINYRLGIFGFLSFGTPEYSGNMGLKDQQLALKWVHENIEQFSGDAERICVFGESAGGAATHLHVLSSESRKYFHNAIAMSGTAENTFAYGDEDFIISSAFVIAKELDDPKTSVEDLIEFFKNVPAKDIVNYCLTLVDHKESVKRFVPIIERIEAKKPFMVKTPTEIYKTENVDKDVAFYHTSSEYVATFEEIMSHNDIFDINKNFSIVLPFRNFNFSFESKEYLTLGRELRAFYFGNATIDESMKDQYLDMLNDKVFLYDIQKSIMMHMKYSKKNAYYIRFSVESTLNLFKRIFHTTLPGTSHCDEVCYMFRSNACKSFYDEVFENVDSEQSRISLQAIELFTTAITLFAKDNTMSPSFDDDLITRYRSVPNDDQFVILEFNNNGTKLIVEKNLQRYLFWKQLEEKADQMIGNRNLS